MQKNYYIPTNKNVMSLTFDDGVTIPTTTIILDLLKKYNVKATFFVLLDNITVNPKILERVIQEGHYVELHGWNHRSWKSHSKHRILKHVTQCVHILQTSFSVTPKYFRPPFGSLTESGNEITKEFHLSPIGWSANAKDWFPHWIRDKTENILNQCSPGKIILMHDGYHLFEHDGGATIKILNNVLPILTQHYSFVSIDELIKSRSILPRIFNKVPLLLHEVVNMDSKTWLRLYWDVNFIEPDKTFDLIIKDNAAIKTMRLLAIKTMTLPYPSPLAMKEWTQSIELPAGLTHAEFFIKDKNNFVKL